MSVVSVPIHNIIVVIIRLCTWYLYDVYMEVCNETGGGGRGMRKVCDYVPEMKDNRERKPWNPLNVLKHQCCCSYKFALNKLPEVKQSNSVSIQCIYIRGKTFFRAEQSIFFCRAPRTPHLSSPTPTVINHTKPKVTPSPSIPTTILLILENSHRKWT